MAIYRLTPQAEEDLSGIAAYTLRTWGEAQALWYIGEIEECCRRLADNPALGRGCDDIRPGLRRMESNRHVVFYRKVAGGVLVSRILHQRMLPENYVGDAAENP